MLFSFTILPKKCSNCKKWIWKKKYFDFNKQKCKGCVILEKDAEIKSLNEELENLQEKLYFKDLEIKKLNANIFNLQNYDDRKRKFFEEDQERTSHYKQYMDDSDTLSDYPLFEDYNIDDEDNDFNLNRQ